MSLSFREHSREQQIAQARRELLADPRSATEVMVNQWFTHAWIMSSWARCLALGHRPDHRVAFEQVSINAGQHAKDQHQNLLDTARPEMERLASIVAPIRYFAILTDASGTVIDTAGNIDRSDPRAEAIARVGVDLSERSIGTSAIGSALGERRPVWIHRGEHFFDATSVYSCAGAPIFAPQGQCIGMLDLTGIEVTERPELQHRVAHSARLIENALALAIPHRAALRLRWPDQNIGDDDSGLVCLDADGGVVGCNTAARQYLPALLMLDRGPVHASELFAAPWQNLIDLSDQGRLLEIPLWSGLRMLVSPYGEPDKEHLPRAAATQGSIKAMEAEMIRQAVRQSGGNVAEAARSLGLSRATVYRRLGSKP